MSSQRPLVYWGRSVRQDGLVTIGTYPTTVSELAVVLDPDAPWVLVTAVGPRFGSGWRQVRMPLHAGEAMRPQTRTVRGVHCEVLLTTAEFQELAPHWDDLGIRALQLTKAPDDRVNFSGPSTPAARYRAFGLVVGFDLPHSGEVAQIVALDDRAMDAALDRSS